MMSQEADKVPQVNIEVCEKLDIYLSELRVALKPIHDRYRGKPFYDQGNQLAKIKMEVGALLLQYFETLFSYPFPILTDWIYVKTLNDRIVDIGLTDKVINAFIKAAYIERFAIGRYVRFIDTASDECKDVVFRIVKVPDGLKPVPDEVYVEPLSGEHKGHLGHIHYTKIDLVAEDEMI